MASRPQLALRTMAVVLLLALAGPLLGQAPQGQNPGALWADFNHYVRIARPDLAQAAGSVLLKTDPGVLLDVVEASEYRDTYLNTLERAGKTEGLKDLSAQLADRIQAARIARSRDPQRIAQDIQKLAGGTREQLNATQRLAAAGQFAAPQMLAALVDEKQGRLHPYIITALATVGQSVVYPLSAALPQLEPRPMGQVAQVLAEIGYPRALPYMKQVLEDAKTDPAAREVVQIAYNRLAAANNLPTDIRAAELFLRLGQNLYSVGTRGGEQVPGFDAAEGRGVVWEYRSTIGLVPVPVPGHVFADVLSRRAAERALTLDPSMDSALSLWLMANLRRHNRLAGQEDASYPARLKSPAYYLRMAGPLRQHDVLARAMDDGDVALALDAIDALADTAGNEALINPQGPTQPLIRALYHPDRRVRLRASLAMAQARPTQAFTGSDRVIRVLAQAVRPSDARTALVLATQQDAANHLAALAKELGFSVIVGTALSDVTGQIAQAPGVDLVVAQYPADLFDVLARRIAGDYRLAALPLVVPADAREQIELNRRYAFETRKPVVVATDDDAAIKSAMQATLALSLGTELSAQEGSDYALAALSALRDLAVGRSDIFAVIDAQPALVRALGDTRAQVVAAAADVLAMLDSAEAQIALANAALDANRPAEQRIMLLNALAESARTFGNRLTGLQLDKVLELVSASEGDLALAASRVHGALTLPAANVVKVISQ